MTAMGAIFGTEAQAEAAIAELREVGLGSEHLGVAVRHGDRVVFEHDEESDLAHDVEKGVGRGAVLGAIGGMLVFAVVGTGFGAGGLLALGAASGFGGAMLGGYFGLGAASDEFDSHEELRHIPREPGEVSVVVVCAHEHPDTVTAVFQRHGGRLVVTES